MTEHSKYYWDTSRNGWDYTTTYDDFSETTDRVPEYYKGKNRCTARKVVDNFDLTYHIGTAVTYLLRAYKKHETPIECIKKAIDHLNFELEKLNDDPEIVVHDITNRD